MTKVINLIGSPNRVLVRREINPASVLMPAGYTDKSNYRATLVLCGRCPNFPELQPGQYVECQFGGSQPVQHHGETLHIIPAFDVLGILTDE